MKIYSHNFIYLQGNFSPVPRDRNAFKLRTNVMKQIHITVQQIPSKDQPELEIKRCFGFLISPRWNVKNSDMQLLDMVNVTLPFHDSYAYFSCSVYKCSLLFLCGVVVCE